MVQSTMVGCSGTRQLLAKTQREEMWSKYHKLIVPAHSVTIGLEYWDSLVQH